MPRLLPFVIALSLGACAHSPTYDPLDPLEKANRVTHGFNEIADRYLLRPVAIAYDWAMPSFARRGVGNFFDNLFYPIVIVNDVLQGKGGQAFEDTGRLIINSTVGIAGFYDAAGNHWKLYRHKEDLGQTFGSWGVGPGWYLVIPFIGPSTNRDFLAGFGDALANPLTYLDEPQPLIADEPEVAWGLRVINVVDSRANLLPADSVLAQQPDRYSFVRGSYLQKRRSLVHDGNPPREDLGMDFDFDD